LLILRRKKFQKSLKLCKLSWTFEVFPKILNRMFDFFKLNPITEYFGKQFYSMFK
jgi:hypothetical protein